MHVKDWNSAGTEEKVSLLATVIIAEAVIGEFYCMRKNGHQNNITEK